MIDYSTLNESQLDAVQSTEGAIRVVASAGSGKTRALAYRYAYLVEEVGIPPQNIACVTFTNKAANEMRERIHGMLGDVDAQYICTFHGLGVKVLHEDIKAIGWPTAFRIMDDDDMTAMLRRVCKKLGCRQMPNMMDLKTFITTQKTSPDSGTEVYYSYVKRLMQKPKIISRSPNAYVQDDEIYAAYLNEQVRSACLDFNDLICIPLYLFEHHPDLKKKWAERFEYVMVDEFQDVSRGNYEFCEAITSVHKNLFVVGDPDQLIYSWRGAKMEYFMDFEALHPGAKTIMLNQNYRCSSRIIDVANRLIDVNTMRIKKSMIGNKPAMEQVRYSHSRTPDEAATFVAEEIRSLHNKGIPYQNIAILYRAHYVSGPYEQQLIKRGIPYMVCSGVPFYQRKEIKDTVAYLGLINSQNPLDFARALSAPSRGLSGDEIEAIVAEAETSGGSLLNVLERKHGRSPRVRVFIDLIQKYIREKNGLSVSDLFSDVFTESGLEAEYKSKEDDERYDNVMTLKNQILDMEKASHRKLTLQAFMDEIGTLTGADTSTKKNQVSLMTVHGAKGLEFPYVFCVGMNEGIFPTYRCNDAQTMEEERRLAYVAFTRAMDKLYIVEAECSGYNGKSAYPSRFIFNGGMDQYNVKNPLDKEFMTRALQYIAGSEISLRNSSPSNNPSSHRTGLQIGSQVNHSIFGKGVVTGIQGDNITVRFASNGASRTLRKDKVTVV